MQAAVHEEVCKLPEKLRLPFILCGLQGRPQKDAAKQLGWTIGTLSGRLSLARQRLLDRLARRGVPVSIAAGATVLGATSGTAGVPNSIAMAALSAVSSPDSISPVVINLARGVTHMYLTRTKLIVAGIVVAGMLTTGIGSHLMSSAGDQAPNKGEADADRLKKAIDEYLRATRNKSQDRWEYKFVPTKSALSAADLQKVLSANDREGWEYCGSQDLMAGGKSIPHLTFKCPNANLRRLSRSAAERAAIEALLGSYRKDASKELLDRALKAASDEAAAKAQANEELQRRMRDLIDRQRKQALEADAAKRAERDARTARRIGARLNPRTHSRSPRKWRKFALRN